MTTAGIVRTVDAGVARLTLSLPERHNAFNDKLITTMIAALERLTNARAMARLMTTVSVLPRPTIAGVYEAALGGGVGLALAAAKLAARAVTTLHRRRSAAKSGTAAPPTAG